MSRKRSVAYAVDKELRSIVTAIRIDKEEDTVVMLDIDSGVDDEHLPNSFSKVNNGKTETTSSQRNRSESTALDSDDFNVNNKKVFCALSANNNSTELPLVKHRPTRWHHVQKYIFRSSSRSDGTRRRPIQSATGGNEHVGDSRPVRIQMVDVRPFGGANIRNINGNGIGNENWV